MRGSLMMGMVPGMLGMSLLIDRLLAVLRHPSALTIILLLVVTAALMVFLAAYGRWIATKRDAAEPGALRVGRLPDRHAEPDAQLEPGRLGSGRRLRHVLHRRRRIARPAVPDR